MNNVIHISISSRFPTSPYHTTAKCIMLWLHNLRITKRRSLDRSNCLFRIKGFLREMLLILIYPTYILSILDYRLLWTCRVYFQAIFTWQSPSCNFTIPLLNKGQPMWYDQTSPPSLDFFTWHSPRCNFTIPLVNKGQPMWYDQTPFF